MKEARNMAIQAIQKFKADGRGPPVDRIDKIDEAIKTVANARRYDLANHIVKNFEKWAGNRGITVRYTAPIARPPVPGYPKIDIDRIIDENQHKENFEKLKKTLQEFVANKNNAKAGQRHLACIKVAQCVQEHIAEACRK